MQQLQLCTWTVSVAIEFVAVYVIWKRGSLSGWLGTYLLLDSVISLIMALLDPFLTSYYRDIWMLKEPGMIGLLACVFGETAGSVTQRFEVNSPGYWYGIPVALAGYAIALTRDKSADVVALKAILCAVFAVTLLLILVLELEKFNIFVAMMAGFFAFKAVPLIALSAGLPQYVAGFFGLSSDIFFYLMWIALFKNAVRNGAKAVRAS